MKRKWISEAKIDEPVLIQGKLAWKMFNLIEAKVIGTWKQQFTIDGGYRWSNL